MTRPRRRALVGVAATVVLVAATIGLLALGIDTRPSFGSVLAAPVAVTRLVGAAIAGAVATATAAVLTAVDAVGATLAARGTRRPSDPAGTLGA